MKYLFTTILICLSLSIQSQVKENDVLFTVDGEPILAYKELGKGGSNEIKCSFGDYYEKGRS